MKGNKKILVIAVLLLLISVSFTTYAIYKTSVAGNAKVTAATWDVKFTDARLVDSTGALDTAHGDADGMLTYTDTTVTATGITFAYPGDAVKLKTVITNAGTLPASLTSVNVNTGSLGNDITVTPATHTQGTQLAAGQACTNEFVIQWKPESTNQSVSGSFTVTFVYDQADQAISITPAHSDT